MKKNSLFRAVAIAAVAVLSVLWLSTASAQVSFSPATLSWTSEDTSAKIVTVYSSGHWTASHTGWELHFNVSPLSGVSGTEVTISPKYVNHTDEDKFEDILFTDGSENTSIFRVTHHSWENSFYVSPESLSWAAGETGVKQVSLHCPGGWTAFTDTPGYTVSPSSGTGDATLTVKPIAANTTGNVRDIVLTIRGDGNDSAERLVHIMHGAAGSTVFETAVSDDVPLQAYDPGITIPYSRGVSPSGAMTYSVPIMVASGLKNAPQLSVMYNSQGGEGVAGFGWELGGLSAITVSNKTVYYDGVMYAADADSPDAVYSLDGVRLVPNSITNVSNTWQYETASSHVLVKKHDDPQGRALWFEAMYPDGSRATFGNSSATAPSVVYPITSSRDRDGNWVRYFYVSDSLTDDIHLQRVEYGVAGNSQILASIGLEYENRTDWHKRYMCGRTMGHSVMLKSISSLNGTDTLRKYTLEHEQREGASLVRRIRMTTPSTISGQPSNEAVPLRFGYGETGAQPAITLVGGNEIFINSIFSSSDTLVYVRGKFAPGSYTDGVLIYAKPTDNDTETMRACFIPSLEASAIMRSYTINSKYDIIQAADITGDGKDEIVAIKNPSGGVLSFFILGVNASGQIFDTGTFSAGSVEDNTSFQWGDYLGLGRMQTLAIGISQDSSGKYTAKYRIVNYAAGTYTNGYFYSGASEEPGMFFTTDLNGDGVSEVCQMTNSGLDIWRASSNGLFNKEKTITGVSSSSLNYGRELMLTDLNADGYMDIVFAPRKGYPDTWFAHYYDGQNFHTTSWAGPLRVASGTDMFMDIDHDGLPDLVSVKKQRLSVYLNERGKIGRTYMEIDAPGVSAEGLVPCNMARLGAASSLMMFDVDYIKEYKVNVPMPERRHLRRFTNSSNVRYETGYGYAAENDGYDPLPEYVPEADSGYFRLSFPGYVVREDHAKMSRTDPDNKRIASNRYRYAGATFNTRGLGFCGFRKTETEDLTHPDTLIIKAIFNPEKRGVPVSDSTFVGNALTASRRFSYDSNFTPYGKLNPRLTYSIETNHLTGLGTGTSYTYGSYDLPVRVLTSRSINGGDGTMSIKTIEYTNSLDSYRYILGMPTTVTETKGSLASKTVITLNESMLPSRTRTYSGTVSGGNTTWNLASDRIVLYDECGNVTSDKTAAYGATTYNETTYIYDAEGRYIRSETDPLGRTTTYLNYDKYGQPWVLSNRLTQETQYGYDYWGRKISCYYPEGTDEYITYSWSASGEPGLYCVSRTVTGQPDTKVWYDALGREVRNANKRFDGSWQYVNTEYDDRYRLYRTSLPYKNANTGPSLWNTYEYDAFDRPVRLTEASGKQTTWSYSGTSTTTTKEGISSTSTTDAEGNVVSVTDAGGTITYALRDDGQPSSVTVTPNGTSQNIVTTFQYDAYGRRSSIVDPSAGTRTDTYTDNTDGSSSVAHTGPNGTVTTNYDRFGRVTSVTRPEFNTIYTYGTTLNSSSYGKLLSETSTNGTSRSFTYDGYGRTASETEYADAGHWMQKSYVYGAGSNVASISYATQAGTITTESYTWTNGHNTGIGLPDGTVVFALTAENDLGQPTAVNSGNVSRTYSFTSAGLPSVRQIRNSQNETVQDLRYSYNAANGNMTWRKDNVLGITESFSYDNLNRLTSANESWNEWTPTEYLYNNAGTTFNSKGNVTGRSYDSQFSLNILYGDPADPYKSTGSEDIGGENLSFITGASATTTSFDRPAGISFDGENAYLAYVYNGGGEKSRASMSDVTLGVSMNRWYIGGVYEKDENTGDSITENAERLFLGGTAYDAPMVLVKAASVNNGVWTPFNIGRDVQGSITEVMTVDGDVVERFRYDPWGIQMDGKVDPVDSLAVEDEIIDTLIALSPLMRTGLSVYVGSHGYTGHEHIYGTGFINCNARLYDPFIGRFLAPDPLIQDPSSTQNFNRYSYCLNNPLKYTDESGEFVISATSAILISAAVFAFGNLGAHAIRGDDLGHGKWAKYFFSGAIAGAVVGASWNFATPLINAPFEAMAGSQSWVCRLIGKQTLFNLKHAYTLMTGINFVGNLYNGIANNNDQWFNNFGKSVLGQFYLDENRNFMGQVWEGISRHTWEGLQQFLGYSWTSLRSPWNDRIDFFGGATFGTYFNGDRGPAATLGSYININSNESNSVIDSYNSFDDYIMSIRDMADEYYTHEFGHTIQSKIWGVFYFAPALMSMWNLRNGATIDHDHYWTETYANSYSYYYFEKHFPSYAFNKSTKPCKY